jgi:hypothetical protein
MTEPIDKQGSPAASNDAAGNLPLLEYCRARAVGDIAEFSECLSYPPTGCTHGVPYGESRFCQHPQHKEIVAWSRRSDS